MAPYTNLVPTVYRPYHESMPTLYRPCTVRTDPMRNLYEPYTGFMRSYTDLVRTLYGPLRTLYGPYTDRMRTLHGSYGPCTDLIRTLYRSYTDLIRTLYGPYTIIWGWEFNVLWKQIKYRPLRTGGAGSCYNFGPGPKVIHEIVGWVTNVWIRFYWCARKLFRFF